MPAARAEGTCGPSGVIIVICQPRWTSGRQNGISAGILRSDEQTCASLTGGATLVDAKLVDMAGVLERIGPFKWRLVIPWPQSTSKLDVFELTPVDFNQQPR